MLDLYEEVYAELGFGRLNPRILRAFNSTSYRSRYCGIPGRGRALSRGTVVCTCCYAYCLETGLGEALDWGDVGVWSLPYTWELAPVGWALPRGERR